MNSTLKHPIILTLLNGTGYLFDLEDYIFIRQNVRIVGAMVGVTNQKGWSASELSMPVALSIYETKFLIDGNFAILVSKKDDLLKTPTEEAIAQSKTKFEINIELQKEELKNKRLAEIERNIDHIIAGKRKKLLEENNGTDECEKLTPEAVLSEIGEHFTFNYKNALVNIPLAYNQSHTGMIVEAPKVDNFKYRVFCNLWQRGYFVTGGDTFGADFLAYPGDPMLYHSAHIIILISDAEISSLRLIAKTRLAVNVNKNCVFAYISNTTDSNESNIKYRTVSWDNSYNDDTLENK